MIYPIEYVGMMRVRSGRFYYWHNAHKSAGEIKLLMD